MILNKQNIGEFFIGLSAAFKAAYADLTSKTEDWKKVAMVLPSTTSENLYGWLSRWPKVRKWVGERHLKNLALNGYRLKNEPFEASTSINLDELDDDSAGMYAAEVSMGWPDAIASFFESNVFNLLKNGGTNLCFDGTAFFNANHPLTSSDNVTTLQSNIIAGGGAAWYLMRCKGKMKPLIVQDRKAFTFKSVTNVEDGKVFLTNEAMYGVDGRYAFGYAFWQNALRSNATLDTAAFDAAYAQMGSLVDEEGEFLGMKPDTLVCGMSNRAAALKCIANMKLPGDVDNHNYNAVEVLVVPWLP